MDIVFFNMSNIVDWQQGVVNRNYFILQELIQREEQEKILLVDFLAIQPVKKIFGKQRTWNYTKWYRKQEGKKIGSFHKLIPLDAEEIFGVKKEIYVFAGLGYLTSSSKSLDLVQQALGEIGMKESEYIVWNYNAFLPQALELPSKLSLFDTVDNWADHASYQKESALLQSNYDQINEEADLVFTVSEGLLDLYTHQEVHWVPNGVATSFFSSGSIPNGEETIIGYVGTIQERVDFELIAYLCAQHPQKQFHFYGPVWKGVQSEVDALQKQFPNIHFFGRVAYKELPAILASFALAIIPHKLDAFLASTNPMKMYDYLAAGKAIVTTPGAGTEAFADIMDISDSKESFSLAIDAAIANNSPKKVEERQNRVKMHSWKQRVDQMLAYISEKR